MSTPSFLRFLAILAAAAGCNNETHPDELRSPGASAPPPVALAQSCILPSNEGSPVALPVEDRDIIQNLPYYTSGSTLINGEEYPTSTFLTVGSDDSLRVTFSGMNESLSATFSGTIDVSAALQQDATSAMVAGGNGADGDTVTFSNFGYETAVFSQAPIVDFSFQVEPLGFYLLELSIGDATGFPASGYSGSQAEEEELLALSAITIRLRGRLLGTCLTPTEGLQLRRVDVLGDERCASLLGHL